MTDNKEFDYIVVGAGSAGCIVAARLTEDPNVKVLILEAGGKDTDPLIRIPLGLGKMHEGRKHDWGYDTEAEARLNGREIEAMRGKVLGGSSSINVMAYVRGHMGDYMIAGLKKVRRDGPTLMSYPTLKNVKTGKTARARGEGALVR